MNYFSNFKYFCIFIPIQNVILNRFLHAQQCFRLFCLWLGAVAAATLSPFLVCPLSRLFEAVSEAVTELSFPLLLLSVVPWSPIHSDVENVKKILRKLIMWTHVIYSECHFEAQFVRPIFEAKHAYPEPREVACQCGCGCSR